MPVKALIFDVDGTLFSSTGIVGPCYSAAIREFEEKKGRPVNIPSVDDIMHEIGNPIPVILKNLFPGLKESERKLIGTAARRNLIALIREGKGLLYPGVRETLEMLHRLGYLLRLASNGNPVYINAITDHYGLSDFFGPFVELDGANLKDKGDILNLHKSLLNVTSGEMVMIGDRYQDFEATQKAGCRFIGAAYGHGDASELSGACRIIHSFNELVEIIPGIEKLHHAPIQ